jgi:hypothetical protein
MSSLSPVDGKEVRGQQARRRKARQCAMRRRRTTCIGRPGRLRGNHRLTGSSSPNLAVDLRPAWGARLAAFPWPGSNILKFLYFSADENFDPGPWNHWIVAAFAASGGGPTWTHRGVRETWPDPTGRKIFFRTRPLDRPPPQGARGRSLPGARHRGRGGRGTRPIPISSSQRPLTQPCVSKDRSSATIWP